MKEKICILLGLIGGAISAAFGGWSGAMTTLLLCMAIDYSSGLIVAGVFHKSRKSATGALDSFAGWKGLCRKGMTLLIVLVAYRLDLALGTGYIRDTVTIGFIANEVISITENAGLMGLPLPTVISFTGSNSMQVMDRQAQARENRLSLKASEVSEMPMVTASSVCSS